MLGPLEFPAPLTIFCKTQECALFYVGPTLRSCALTPGRKPNGATYLTTRPAIAVLRVDEEARSFTEHEMIHVEMSGRMHGVFVPAWFHEGLATFVSDNMHCDGITSLGIDDLTRLDWGGAWSDYTNLRGTITATYCQAKKEVAAWVHEHGRDGLLALIDGTRHGSSFYAVYGPMLTASAEGRTNASTSISTELADNTHAFSLSLWVKPTANAGVLVHLSETPVGTGWCNPVLGFDAEHHLVSQLNTHRGAEPSNFAIAVDPTPLPLGKWSHLAMSWAPGGQNRLYVNGAKVAEAPAPTIRAPGPGTIAYATWGSYNLGGLGNCWLGAITGASFQGGITGTQIHARELTAAEIEVLARSAP